MYKYHPNLISSLAMHNLVDSQSEIDGSWQPARPISYPSLIERLRLTWLVFTGKADVLIWPKQ